MYLMYKSYTENSIWVPLNVTTWAVKASATRSGNTWTKDAGSTKSSSSADTNNYPEWDDNFKNWEFQNVAE